MNRIDLIITIGILITLASENLVADIGVGATPVDGAELLLDGSRELLDRKWTYWQGPRFASELPIKWKIVEDPVDEGTVVMSDDPAAAGGKYGAADIVTNHKYRDFRLHVEFLIMKPGGNSGVYLQNRYEIQVLDGDDSKHGMGAVINESESPYAAYNGVRNWNAYDIVFRAARFEDGKRAEKALLTMYFNGKLAHENFAINKVWGGKFSGLDGGNNDGLGITDRPGGLKLQCEGHDVRFRNIWIKKLDLVKPSTTFKEPVAKSAVSANSLYALENLVAWCIVPFDAKQRTPAERAEMVKRLGFTKVAYDWRAEHVPTFEQEILEYRRHGIDFFAFWSWHDAMEPLIHKYNIRPQIWITSPSPKAATEDLRVAMAAEQLAPMVEKTRSLGLRLGLYNHGGWGGRPVNLVAVCRYLREHHQAGHVGIVYNFHHAHQDLTNFRAGLEAMQPYLCCLNLNGMTEEEEANYEKILALGSGEHELEMMRDALAVGYDGPVGIIDHRSQLDAEESLRANLDGLARLRSELSESSCLFRPSYQARSQWFSAN